MSAATFAILAVYLIPSIVSHVRHHRNTTAITVLNILLGWTALGWIIALIWACTDNVRPKLEKAARAIQQRPPMGPMVSLPPDE